MMSDLELDDSAMCDERERLIGYVYDECDASERAAVQDHLTTCAECRQEIAALRAVRRDLLAWEIPDHESVWRPFAPARAMPTWRDVPAWALAAAASLVFVAGAAGGVATQALLPDRPPVVAAQPAGALPVGTAVTAEDLAGLEQRLRAEMEAEMTQRVDTLASEYQAVVAEVRSAQASDPEVALAAVRARLDDVDEVLRKQAALNLDLQDRTMRMWNAQGSIRQLDPAGLVLPVNFGPPAGR